MKIMKNVISGQCANALIRVQIRYTAFFFGVGWLPKGWHGVRWGFFAPAHNPDVGYRCVGFYGTLLPGMPGAVSRWPKWYRLIKKQMTFRRTLIKNFV